MVNNRQSTIVKVLVVDDSPTARDFLVHLLSGPMIQVIGTASNGAEAVEFVKRTKPDVITMDIHMPGMDGIEATRRIMETVPVPIVIVSANWDPREVEMTFRAMEAGALALVRRPPGTGIRTTKLRSRNSCRKCGSCPKSRWCGAGPARD